MAHKAKFHKSGAHSYHEHHGKAHKHSGHYEKKHPSPEGGKVHKVMHEFKHHTLHSGSKHGPKVKSRDQAVAIALSEQRKQNRGGYK